jgi:hypothetical protein
MEKKKDKDNNNSSSSSSSSSNNVGIPWEDRLAALLPNGKEDLPWLKTTFVPMRTAGWKDRMCTHSPMSDCKSFFLNVCVLSS